MDTYNRVIIGAGTSAAVYLSYFPVQANEKVVVIGFKDPWSKRGGHRMGQPPHLIELPMPKKQSAVFPVKEGSQFIPPVQPILIPYRVPMFREHFQLPEKSDKQPEEPFLRSDLYAESVKELLGDIDQIEAKVTHVERVNDGYQIDLEGKDSIKAKKVIIASGPGQSNISKAWNAQHEGLPRGTFVSGEAFLNEDISVIKGVIAVEGGSATAAWAVEKAIQGGAKRVFWFNRSADVNTFEKRFGDAFPVGGRNEWLKSRPYQLIQAIDDVQSSRTVEENKLEVEFKSGLRIVVSQYVAATGTSGGLNFLDEGLKGSLEEIQDTRKLLHANGKAVLGLKSADGSLLVVGPALNNKEGYKQANVYLPHAARPRDGIPTIIATISALRRYEDSKTDRWVGFNLQSFAEMDEYFKNAVGYFLATLLDDGAALEGIGGYSLKEVAEFVTDQVIGSRMMNSSPYGVSEDEVRHVFDQIHDFAYEHLSQMRGAEWKPLLDEYFKSEENHKNHAS